MNPYMNDYLKELGANSTSASIHANRLASLGNLEVGKQVAFNRYFDIHIGEYSSPGMECIGTISGEDINSYSSTPNNLDQYLVRLSDNTPVIVRKQDMVSVDSLDPNKKHTRIF